MSKRRIIALIILSAIALTLTFTLSHRLRVAYHTRNWHRAMQLNTGGPAPLLDRMYGALMNKQPQHWWKVANHHEAELLRLGYLTNSIFRLTNQVMTREFSSNFFRLIHLRAGTNEDQVWRCPFLTNRTGISPIFPAKDYVIWEQSFRECVAYASNLPPESAVDSRRER